LIQHRDNRVTLEQPNARHLQLWTQLWERTNATSATFAVASFYEYERIIQCLNEKDFEPQ
jgi:hypothetical protein